MSRTAFEDSPEEFRVQMLIELEKRALLLLCYPKWLDDGTVPQAELKVYEGGPHGVFVTHIKRLTDDLHAFAKG